MLWSFEGSRTTVISIVISLKILSPRTNLQLPGGYVTSVENAWCIVIRGKARIPFFLHPSLDLENLSHLGAQPWWTIHGVTPSVYGALLVHLLLKRPVDLQPHPSLREYFLLCVFRGPFFPTMYKQPNHFHKFKFSQRMKETQASDSFCFQSPH